MIYLVLYDESGKCQRVARADTDEDAQVYRNAGFVEVTPTEYDRCAAIAPETNRNEIPLLIAALGALRAATTRTTTQTTFFAANRDALDRIRSLYANEATVLTNEFFNRQLSINDWYENMAATIRRNHTAARIAGVNGVNNLTQRDINQLRTRLDGEMRALNRLRRQLENGEVSEAQAQARMQQYANSTGVTFEQAYTNAIGLPSMPVYPGERSSCHTNCKCRWDYQQLDGNGNFDCYWVLGRVEHCKECVNRAAVFNPLQIRNGIIQPFSPLGIFT